MELFILAFSGMLMIMNIRIIVMFAPMYKHLYKLDRGFRFLDSIFALSLIISTIVFGIIIMNPIGIISPQSIFIFNLNYFMYCFIMIKILQRSNYMLGLGQCKYFNHFFGKAGYFHHQQHHHHRNLH